MSDRLRNSSRGVCVVGLGGDDDPTSHVLRITVGEALAAIGRRGAVDAAAMPSIADELRLRLGCAAVCMLPVEATPGAMPWIASDDASGWIELARGTPIDVAVWATMIDEALGRGFVAADAVLLGAAGQSSSRLPRLSWGEDSAFAPVAARSVGGRGNGDGVNGERHSIVDDADRPIGIYAIVDSADAVHKAIDAGITTIQLRIKRPPDANSEWESKLRSVAAAALARVRDSNAELVLNDHWRVAADLGIRSVHLGQDDLSALSSTERAAIVASGVKLGISSHSVWELCRARSLPTRYIACGPVWPTTTKDMPWIPQGPDNLAWWCANAGQPVVAIGGILEPRQARIVARSGADGVCLVRALQGDAAKAVPAFADAFERGRNERAAMSGLVGRWPHPTLPPRR